MNVIELFYVLLAIGAIIAVGQQVRKLGRRFQIPPAVSLMALGAIIGSSGFAILPDAYPEVGAYLSKGALVLLLLRAGLGISPTVLRKIAIPVVVFGIIPVVAELGVVAGGAHWFLFSNVHLALLAGFLVAAVSPAVILPTMLDQKYRGRGAARHVPDRIIGQTVVNALIAQTGILLMLDVLDPQSGQSLGMTLLLFPVNFLGGILVGIIAGSLLRLDIILGGPNEENEISRNWLAVASASLVSLVVYFGCSYFGLESVFATLAVGITLRHRLRSREQDLREFFRRVWSVAEIILFVNLGSFIDVGRLTDIPLVAGLLVLMAVALLCRVVVTRLLLESTRLTQGEKAYVTTAQLPKATIQAVFGAVIFLRLSEEGGAFMADAQTFLIMAVLAIVATAPIGALLLDRWGQKMLAPDEINLQEQEDRKVSANP